MKKKTSSSLIVDNRLELLFRHAGLSEKQATLYRLLLTDGEARPSTLSKKSGIKRGNVYALLKDLAFRGLVTEFEKDKVTFFRPEPPEKLANIIEARQKDVEMAKSLAADLLPRLTSQWKTSINRPLVSHYEGKDGMEKVLEDIYGPKSGDNIVWGCVDIERMHIEFPEKLDKKLIPLRQKHKWIAKSVFVDNPGGRALKSRDHQELRESSLVDGSAYPLPAEIDVYDDKITMLSFEQNEFVGLIIQNESFAQTLRSIFKLALAGARSQQTLLSQPQRQADQASAGDPRRAQKQNTLAPSPRLYGKTPAS
ncbi:MAG: helix-turn-helix domain-containing protein [Candidatus Gottesmanbacteria bacterium]|nr:helix-turn-helix domain-containing protein [Candidatus Gottesmanbacteria bacterium]